MTCHFKKDHTTLPLNQQERPVNCFQEGRCHARETMQKGQANGTWTPERRAKLLQEAICLRHQDRRWRSYYAGWIAALRSDTTADFSKDDVAVEQALSDQQHQGYTVCRSLEKSDMTCCEVIGCHHAASWDYYPQGEWELMMALCNTCKEDLLVLEASITDGESDLFSGTPLLLDACKETPVLLPETTHSDQVSSSLQVPSPEILCEEDEEHELALLETAIGHHLSRLTQELPVSSDCLEYLQKKHERQVTIRELVAALCGATTLGLLLAGLFPSIVLPLLILMFALVGFLAVDERKAYTHGTNDD